MPVSKQRIDWCLPGPSGTAVSRPTRQVKKYLDNFAFRIMNLQIDLNANDRKRNLQRAFPQL